MNKGEWKQRLLAVFTTLAMVFGCVNPVTAYAASSTVTETSDKTYTEDGGSYDLYYILNNFNLFIQNDVTTIHTVGEVAIGGNLNLSGNMIGKTGAKHKVSSYVAGEVTNYGGDAYHPDNDDVFMCLGSVNKGKDITYTSGMKDGPFRLSDNYLDMDAAFDAINAAVQSNFSETALIQHGIELKAVEYGQIKGNGGSGYYTIDFNSAGYPTLSVTSGQKDIVVIDYDNWTSVTEGKSDKTYTVSEIDCVENYVSELTKTSVDENGNMKFTITHTLDKSKIERRNIAVKLNNVWNDESDLYNMRPNRLRTRLMRNNKKYAEVEACADKGWVVEFANVPVVGDYSIEVTTPEGYTTEVKIDSIDENGNIKVTATHELNEDSTLQTIKIRLDNIWNDNDDATHRRPAYLKVMLKRNGINCFDEPVTVRESNNWSYTTDKLPKLGTYTAEVTSPTGYLTTITADDISDGVMTIKAEHNLKPAPESTNLVAKVVWNDKDNAAGKRPDSIKIDIQQDGKSIHTEPQPITKDKNWTMTVLGVKKDAAYTAKVSRVDGYDATVKDATVEDGQTTIEIVYTMKEEIAPTPAPTEAPKPTEKPSEPEQTKVESKTETKTEEKTPAPADASSTAPKVVIKTDVKPTGVSFLASLFGK